jgi:hypothetical protein
MDDDDSVTVFELYPGAGKMIQGAIEAGGGLVCETHPWRPWEGEIGGCDCGAPGMIRQDAIDQGLLIPSDDAA